MTRLTAAQASRVAVAAQGLAAPRPAGTVTRAHLRRLMGRIQVLQLDSVSVAVRAALLALLLAALSPLSGQDGFKPL